MAATGQPVITRLDPPNALSAPYVPQQNRSSGTRSHHRPVTLAERPKLWDVQIQLPGTDIHKKQPSLCWDEIMPIAVTCVKEEKRSRLDSSTSSTPPSAHTNSTGLRFCRWLCCCCWCCSSEPDRSSPAETQQRRSDVAVKKLTRKLPKKELQVAVTITMPCRPYRVLPDWYFPDTDPMLWDQWEAWLEGYTGLDFAIGVHTCRWDDEG
ncbi:hypothetical protein M378DRAFT_163607 [Amanita muscaria Koide BX008]|uniref:Uncharacterized protein n=1 Tax=Amanita muscaria (strain Koide BX008) TaxID=946122 RepID=A0A0C2WR39_AMAMK|nr:hypothetical protein M378DRAFT_163607 [Amanita muscaria Koide BX008]